MNLLRAIARWSAGPVLGITLGLVLGTLTDGPAAPPARLTLRGGPPEAVRLAEATHSLPVARPRSANADVAAAGD